MSENKLKMSSSPHIRSKDTSGKIMPGTLWKLEHWGKREGCLPWQAPLQDIFLLLFDTTTPPSPKRVDVNAILLADLCTGKLSRENQVVHDRTRDTQNRHYVGNG